jgi:tetrahydrofolate dehydrogenase/cyclohydrolase-like protein
VQTRAGAITPVPGGVGLMTVAMLLKNTLAAAERASEGASVAPSEASPQGQLGGGLRPPSEASRQGLRGQSPRSK